MTRHLPLVSPRRPSSPVEAPALRGCSAPASASACAVARARACLAATLFFLSPPGCGVRPLWRRACALLRDRRTARARARVRPAAAGAAAATDAARPPAAGARRPSQNVFGFAVGSTVRLPGRRRCWLCAIERARLCSRAFSARACAGPCEWSRLGAGATAARPHRGRGGAGAGRGGGWPPPGRRSPPPPCPCGARCEGGGSTGVRGGGSGGLRQQLPGRAAGQWRRGSCASRPRPPSACAALDAAHGARPAYGVHGDRPARRLLHGGPGAGCYSRRGFPDRYGGAAGPARLRREPLGGLEHNTAEQLVEDLELLRAHLDIDSWLLFGGSWGTTLALAYASRHPSRVWGMIMRGVCLLRRSEIDWVFREGGASALFPRQWDEFVGALPEDERTDPVAAYAARMCSPDASAGVRAAAVRAWGRWSMAVYSGLPRGDERSSASWDGNKWTRGRGRVRRTSADRWWGRYAGGAA